MTTTLRRVLQAFEEADTSIRLDVLSRNLGIDPGTLDSMIQHWIRKGRIKEVRMETGGCYTCDVQTECPFVMRLPRSYTLVRASDKENFVPECCVCSERQ
jgi:hypothetical protein